MSNLYTSDDEISRMLIEGLVSEWLHTEHSELLKKLRNDAKNTIATLTPSERRQIVAIKVGRPHKVELSELISDLPFREI